MTTEKIKLNSHTQQDALGFIIAVDRITQKIGINKEEWNALVFEYGMQFLWQHYTREEALSIASGKASKFWAMWITIWAEDDAELLAIIPHDYSYNKYCEDKKVLHEIKINIKNEKV